MTETRSSQAGKKYRLPTEASGNMPLVQEQALNIGGAMRLALIGLIVISTES